ncbi:hypothetical protein [Planctellipticum variicoloris]|uniref:hypothetical protein n=1 Tax=Planctellipticum variicoloris TaxID=3064265 RepID=UPI0030135BA5|nr:hypothetical protein SH412_002787 [Planctomycetaceae bacterium SH412]
MSETNPLNPLEKHLDAALQLLEPGHPAREHVAAAAQAWTLHTEDPLTTAQYRTATRHIVAVLFKTAAGGSVPAIKTWLDHFAPPPLGQLATIDDRQLLDALAAARTDRDAIERLDHPHDADR